MSPRLSLFALLLAPALAAQTPAFDRTFDGDGVLVIFDANPQRATLQVEDLRAVLPMPDGGVVVAGTGQYARRTVAFLRRYRADGRLDPTFAGGQWRYAPLDVTHTVDALALLPDGRLIAAGTELRHGLCRLLFRLGTDGATDPAFGKPLRPEGCNGGGVMRLTVLPDGRLLVVGKGPILVVEETRILVEDRPYVARLTATGAPDSTFGKNGVVAVTSRSADYVRLLRQADGRWLLFNEPASFTMPVPMARLTTDGQPDPTFGTNGTVLLDSLGFVPAATLLPDGRVIVAGPRHLLRLHPDGRRDSTFGTAGMVRFGDVEVRHLALQPDGKVLVGGDHRGDLVLRRLHPDGTPDRAFGTDGRFSFKVLVQGRLRQRHEDDSYSVLKQMVLEPGGRLALAGSTTGNFLSVTRLLLGDVGER